MTTDTATANLEKINHIVVLMMENRSFDHMLGYLGLPGGIQGVNGLQHAQPNYDTDGIPHSPKRLGRDRSAFHLPGKPYDRALDPCHAPDCVKEQLEEYRGSEPGGFVKNFITKNKPPAGWQDLPMGYYDQECLPVYDFLARQHAVCDAWHSAVPGDTWPNRLHSLAGRTGPKVHFDLLERLIAALTGKKPFIPIYEVDAFTRLLADAQWRWYSHDPATLRAADRLYRDFSKHRQNFTYFDRKRITDLTELIESPIDAHDSFLDDAAKGQLRQVSWIDPNFIDLHVLHSVSNDDHPPADILAGQALVLEIYHALVNTKGWENTLLVVCYDEHGGMYDHVSPPPVDDGSGFPTYGVRVPALLVGPRVTQGVHSQLLDHSTLIKTILTRFAANPGQALATMPKRVQESPHLGDALQATPRADIPGHEHLFTIIDEWRDEARAERRVSGPQAPSPAADGAGQPLVPNDFQAEFAKLAGLMRKKGLPAGQP
jgi:phospholipase C